MLNLIRRAIKEDLNKINELGMNLHENFEKSFHIETEIDNPLAIVLVSVEDEVVNGYLYAINLDDNADIISIYVDENNRLRHIGFDLVKKLQEICSKKTITLEVRVDNKKAINLYKKCGFREISIRKKYYQGSDGYLMKWGI